MAFFVSEYSMRPLNNKIYVPFGQTINRRDCLRHLVGSLCLALAPTVSLAWASEIRSGPSILEKYLGEELRYQIGYWLIGNVGTAKSGFLRTNLPGIYRISIEGRGAGLINSLLGGIVYDYISFCRYLPNQDRLQPLYFELTRQRGTKKRVRTVSYNYKAGEISYLETTPVGETHEQIEPMRTDRNYEDYLTLFFNFRHGYYGHLQRDHHYSLPLYVKEQMNPVTVHIADLETEKKFRAREFKRTDKDLFVRFQIPPEDVSSGSGEILGWFSNAAVPVKGTIQDVIFFGDLWGEIKGREKVANPGSVLVPSVVQNLI
jgi:hypothetical protein